MEPDIIIKATILLWGAVLFGAIAGLMELSQRNWRINLRILLILVTIGSLTFGFTVYVIRTMSMGQTQ
jgi:hypothetical protein